MEYYYVLQEKPSFSDEEMAVIETCPKVPGIKTWLLGQKFSKPVPEPLIFDLHPYYIALFPDYFNESIPLFSDKLLSALKEIRVDNIDIYQAHIVDTEDSVVTNKYKAVNIIGLISLANREENIHYELPLLFRDERFDIVVHEKVKKHLLDNGFEKLGFSYRGTL